jgi:hypothetical protein
MDKDIDARIRARAYHIWENDPSPGDNAQKHWDEARRQLEAEGVIGDDARNPGADQSADRDHAGRPAPAEQLQDMQADDAPQAERSTRSGRKS